MKGRARKEGGQYWQYRSLHFSNHHTGSRVVTGARYSWENHPAVLDLVTEGTDGKNCTDSQPHRADRRRAQQNFKTGIIPQLELQEVMQTASDPGLETRAMADRSHAMALSSTQAWTQTTSTSLLMTVCRQ
ncbi:hypothetical protein BaRGS_00009865 [Batillaria attramentaria]|uniref:Uncharacterized protein n=1 Tax=Batillaria attramentaria TaxID=370345 RepID=A0ABD0LH91_9CAEN